MDNEPKLRVLQLELVAEVINEAVLIVQRLAGGVQVLEEALIIEQSPALPPVYAIACLQSCAKMNFCACWLWE